MRATPYVGSFAAVWLVLMLFLSAEHAYASQCLRAATNTFCFDRSGRLISFRVLDGESIPVLDDGFILSLDGQLIRSSDLAAPARILTKNTILYRFVSGEFRIDLACETRPTWAFVSKQLTVHDSVRKNFTVGLVSPIAMELQHSSQAFVAHPTFPQFTQSTAAKQPPDLQALSAFEQVRFLRFSDHHSLLVTVQNPFTQSMPAERGFRLGYRPELRWPHRLGSFTSDRVLLGIAVLTGRRLAQRMSPEWTEPAPALQDGADEGEVAAMTGCVRAFLQTGSVKTTRNVIGWTLNDYQIDAATQKGREQYRRIFNVAARVHADNVLYGPSNSSLAAREADIDEAHWEHVTWLGLGPAIRREQWSIAKSRIPPTVSNALTDAKAQHLRLLAYVFPTLPLHRQPTVASDDAGTIGRKALLASVAYQDRLVHDLLVFKRRTGVAGYSFDFISLSEPGASQYAQWFGLRRVLAALRASSPDIVLDGRQWYQLYGPWSWLSGTYPHPLGTDEQPESFKPFPDLHFDRVSANRQRYVAYWYRNYQFCPVELLPGYMTHQTPRKRGEGNGQLVLSDFRLRDWDSLGWKFSVLASIATGGWHSVVNYLPARDAEDENQLSEADRAWLVGWLDFARTHKDLLRHTMTILGQPSLGHADGTAAITNNHGYIFLFNPNYEPRTVALSLDSTVGLNGPPGTALTISELTAHNTVTQKFPNVVYFHIGETLEAELPGSSASVFKISGANTRDAAHVRSGVAKHESTDLHNPRIFLSMDGKSSGEFGGHFTVPDWLRAQVRNVDAGRPFATKTNRLLGSDVIALFSTCK